MKRREFLVLGGASMAWPLTAVAQSRKPATLGILVARNPDPTQLIKGIKDGLRDLGYVEGTDIIFELRIGGADAGDLVPLAAALVARKVDILFAYPTPAATAIKQATKSIPIVILSADPVGTGLVESLARPGGNITGVSTEVSELGAKNLELLREVLPTARRVAVLANADDPFNKSFIAHIQKAAPCHSCSMAARAWMTPLRSCRKMGRKRWCCSPACRASASPSLHSDSGCHPSRLAPVFQQWVA